MYEKTLKENNLVEDTTIILKEINSPVKKTPNCTICFMMKNEVESEYYDKGSNGYFCEKCFEKLFSKEIKQEMLKKGTLIDLKEKEINLCNEHEKEIEGICKCGVFFCKNCILFDNKHEGHERVDIKNEKFETILKEINKKKIESLIENKKIYLREINDNEKIISENLKEIEELNKKIEIKKNINQEKEKINEELLISLQKLINFENIIEKKPFQFLFKINQILNFKNLLEKNEKNKKLENLIEYKNIYSFGRNDYGQLGKGDTNNQIDLYENIELNKLNIIKISSGYEHTVILTKNNEVYSFGDNSYGQLGQSNNNNLNIPTLIKYFTDKKIINICCGEYHTVALAGNI